MNTPTETDRAAMLQQAKRDSQAKCVELKQLEREAPTAARKRELLGELALEQRLLETLDQELDEAQQAAWNEQAAARRAVALKDVPQLVAAVAASQSPIAKRLTAIGDEVVALLSVSLADETARADRLVHEVRPDNVEDHRVAVRAAASGRSTADAAALATMLRRIAETFGFRHLEQHLEFNHTHCPEVSFEHAVAVNVRTLAERLS